MPDHTIPIPTEPLEEAARQAARCLKDGGVIVAPTETVYGLMTLWTNAAGRGRIYALKARPRDKRLQMLVPDLDSAAASGVVVDARLQALSAAFWPGPLTVVCPATCGNTVGVRIPDHPFVLRVLKCLGEALAATSANRSGEPAAGNVADALAGLAGEPALAFDGGPCCGGTASTVVSLLATDPVILRPGPITEADIIAALA